jgi:uncharacterized membrane protein (DUF373 family)
VLSNVFDPTDHVVFQTVFGMIFTVIIALEFKRSLLVVTERRMGIVQVRTVILLAMLAIVRKLIILDLQATEALQIFALGAAILSLGADQFLTARAMSPVGRREYWSPYRRVHRVARIFS